MKIVFILLLLSSSLAHANDSWYIQLFGGTLSSMPEYDKIDQTEDLFRENFNITAEDKNRGLSGMGLYITLNSTLVGYTQHSWGSRIEGELKSNNDDLAVDFDIDVRALSIIHYMNSEVGKGLNFRLDIGKAVVQASPDSMDSFWGTIFDPDSTGNENYNFDDNGQAINLGVAYGFKPTDGSSFDFGLMYTFIKMEDQNIDWLALTYAFTW